MADSTLLDTAPDTPATTLEHPIRSAPVSRSRVRPRGRRRGEETAVVGVLLLAIAVMIAALGYLAGGPPLQRTVPLGRQPDPVTTTTLSSRGTSPTARREASPVAAASPHAAAVTGDPQSSSSPSRGDAADPVGSVPEWRSPPDPGPAAPAPAADQPAATTTTGPPPAVEPPAPAESTTTTGPPPTQPPPTEPPPVTVPPPSS